MIDWLRSIITYLSEYSGRDIRWDLTNFTFFAPPVAEGGAVTGPVDRDARYSKTMLIKF